MEPAAWLGALSLAAIPYVPCSRQMFFTLIYTQNGVLFSWAPFCVMGVLFKKLLKSVPINRFYLMAPVLPSRHFGCARFSATARSAAAERREVALHRLRRQE